MNTLMTVLAALILIPAASAAQDIDLEKLCGVAYGACPATKQTELVKAAGACRLDEVKRLVETEKLDVNALDAKTGTRALNTASFFGCVPVTLYLLEAGADPDLSDRFMEWTPLMAAAEKCHDEAVRALVCVGRARVAAADGKGNTAESLARHALKVSKDSSYCQETLQIITDPGRCLMEP